MKKYRRSANHKKGSQTFLFVTLFLFLHSLACVSLAQPVNLSDSLSHIFKNKPIPTAKIDTRNSFITGRSARIVGVKAGVSFAKRLSVGVSYSWLHNELEKQLTLSDGVTAPALIKLRYAGPFIDYQFYRKGPWEANMPVQIGFGNSFMQRTDRDQTLKFNKGSVFLYEPAMVVEYKILNLIGVGGGIGYRIMLRNNNLIDEQFTSPVYVLRFRLIFEEIYRRVSPMIQGNHE